MRFYLNSIKNPSPLKCDEQEGSYRQDMDSVGIYHEPAKTLWWEVEWEWDYGG